MSHPSTSRREVSVRTDPPEPTAATPTDGPAPAMRRSLWQWLGGALSTVFVVGMLAALAYWGHTSDWTLPKFSTLAGTQKAETDDWCSAHNVPESECIECNPALIPQT